MKLELKHLAPYLPHELKWIVNGSNHANFTTIGITYETIYTNEGQVLNWKKYDGFTQVLFPLLRPLSDLTKEIEINGEKFVPSEKFGLVPNTINQRHLQSKIENDYITYKEICLLFEWHFDVFELIPEGLAIDINTL